MNKYLAIIAAALVMNAFADTPAFELVNDPQGYSYLQINENMENFAFSSDFKSIGNSGKVGVYFYPAGLEGDALKDYMATFDADDAKFMKKLDNGIVTIGDVAAGDRIGFYLLRNNGDLIRDWDFAKDHKGKDFIEFDKNHSSSSKDEWMSIGNVSWGAEVPVIDSDYTASGAPLPGSLAVLLVGGLFAGAKKLRKRNA